MVVQTTYSTQHLNSLPGMIATQELLNTVSGLLKQDPSDPVSFGMGVIKTEVEDALGKSGSWDVGAEVNEFNKPYPFSTAPEFGGILIRELNRVTGVNGDFLPSQDHTGGNPLWDVTVGTVGTFWVPTTPDSVDLGSWSDVYLRVGATDAGMFTNAAGAAGTLSVLIPHAQFLTSPNTAGLVKLALGLNEGKAVSAAP